MIYKTKDLIKLGRTKYSIRQNIKEGSLFQIQRGIYSTEDSNYPKEVVISKKYPFAILTSLSAFYIYGLTDQIPTCFYLATEQHSFPIRKKDVIQSYQESSFFEIGATYKQLDEGLVKIYDLERLLIELIRLKEKYPRELYYEVLNSFRKIKNQIDFYKVNQYLKQFSNGQNILLKIKELI